MPLLAGAAADRLAVATVVRRLQLGLFLRVEVAVGPAHVVAASDPEQFLTRRLGVLLVGVHRPQIERVATVLHDPQRVINGADIHAHGIANAAGEMLAGGWSLACLARVELPDAGASLQLGTGIGPLDRAAAVLAGVGRRADVHVEHTVAIDGERLDAMAAAWWQIPHDRVRRSCGLHGTRRNAIANHRGARLGVEIALEQPGLARAEVPEPGAHIRLAVMVRVAEGDHSAAPAYAPPARDRDEHIAVRRDDHVPGRLQALGEQRRTESGGENHRHAVRWAGAAACGLGHPPRGDGNRRTHTGQQRKNVRLLSHQNKTPEGCD